MTRKKSDDAISPVVGVMLMLVVTIVLVAVIATFSTGLAAEAEPAPSVKLKVEVDSTWSNFDYGSSSGGLGSAFLTSVNGEPVNLEKVAVTLYNEDGKSYTYTHPSQAGGVGQYLESGETLNLAYGHFPACVYLIGEGTDSNSDYSIDSSEASGGVLPVIAGTSIRAVVTYDDTHVLYDKEVAVV